MEGRSNRRARRDEDAVAVHLEFKARVVLEILTGVQYQAEASREHGLSLNHLASTVSAMGSPMAWLLPQRGRRTI
jgi:hypothetical protein